MDNLGILASMFGGRTIIPSVRKSGKSIMLQQKKMDLKWQSESVIVIQENLLSRKAKHLPNDWKVGFLEQKLQEKKSIIGRLRKAVSSN